MLQRNQNHFEVEEFNILHLLKVADLIYKSYSECNLIWNILPSNPQETKIAIVRRLHKCLHQNSSHVVMVDKRIIACIISTDIKNLESILEEENQSNLPLIFEYSNQKSKGFFEKLLEVNQVYSKKSAVMLFAAIDSEYAANSVFFHLLKWNIEQLLQSGYQDYYGIVGNSRFLKLAGDQVKLISQCQISDQEQCEIDKYRLSLIKYAMKPLNQRPCL